jgi:uncharacterized protein
LKTILTFGRYTKKKYGTRVFKVPISISGFTCPNIDGTTAVGGCTFCENDSFSPNLGKAQPLDHNKKFYLNLESKTNPHLDLQLKQLELQFTNLSNQQRKKFGAKKFIVYFQSFTNTYAPLETLKALYQKALSFPNVVGLSIGTRSDSITQETLDYLAELNKDKEIWIEFGIQSVYDETLERINRGHDAANVKEWIQKSKEAGLKVCGHLIYGLPGETKEMMIETFEQSIQWDLDSLKFHSLYVMKKTALANEFARGDFTPIDEETYIDLLSYSLKKLPKHIVVQRISAGIDDPNLLAPNWSINKNQQFRNLRKRFKDEGIIY